VAYAPHLRTSLSEPGKGNSNKPDQQLLTAWKQKLDGLYLMLDVACSAVLPKSKEELIAWVEARKDTEDGTYVELLKLFDEESKTAERLTELLRAPNWRLAVVLANVDSQANPAPQKPNSLSRGRAPWQGGHRTNSY